MSPSNDPPRNKKVKFVYDYMGRRVFKWAQHWDDDEGESGDWVTDVLEKYVYDGWNVVLVLDDDNVTQRKYTWGLDLSGSIDGAAGIGGLLAAVETQGTPSETDDQRYWFFYDANGNVGQVLDATDTGNITIAARYEYDPYGNLIASSGSYADANPFRFSTKWFDDETGLYYYGYRYYSPRLGRWISRDPIGEEGGIALYVFNRNAAINKYDLLGLVSMAIQPTTSDLQKTRCGSFMVKWRFDVAWYDCYMDDYVYLIQRVELSADCLECTTKKCRKTKGEPPEKPKSARRRLVYYEVWELSTYPGVPDDSTGRNGPGISTQDTATFGHQSGCCGGAIQRGEVRAFCSSKGDLIWKTMQQWKDNVGVEKDEKQRTVVGRFQCGTDEYKQTSGTLAYKEVVPGKPPLFWNQGAATAVFREASSAWNCCCDARDKAGYHERRGRRWIWIKPIDDTSQVWASP